MEVAGAQLAVVHAYNTPEGRSTRKQHKRGQSVGYVLSIDGITVYHAGDTDLIPEMGQLPAIDAAFLPVGGTFTMDAEEASSAVSVIRPRLAVPMHYRSRADAETFKHEVGIRTDCDARPLLIGETLTLP